MPIDSPRVTADLVSLTPEQAVRYEQVKRLIADIAREPDGEMFILNALLQTGDQALTNMALLTDVIIKAGWDGRDVAGMVYERPLGLPRLEL